MTKIELKQQYERVCNDYLQALLEAWELESCHGYWIADEVGGVYDYDGCFTINMDEIIYCVEHDVKQQQFIEWQEYCCDAAEFGFNTPNFKSWMAGCPRTDEDTFKHLRSIKIRLNDAIQEEKERIEGEKTKVNF